MYFANCEGEQKYKITRNKGKWKEQIELKLGTLVKLDYYKMLTTVGRLNFGSDTDIPLV